MLDNGVVLRGVPEGTTEPLVGRETIRGVVERLETKPQGEIAEQPFGPSVVLAMAMAMDSAAGVPVQGVALQMPLTRMTRFLASQALSLLTPRPRDYRRRRTCQHRPDPHHDQAVVPSR